MVMKSLADVLESTRKHLDTADTIAAMKVDIPLLRRIMPNVIASEICSVQPVSMTGTFSMRFNALRATGCSLECTDKTWGYVYDTVVDFHAEHPVYNVGTEAQQWAVENCRSSYTYGRVNVSCNLETRVIENVWRWSFLDKDEAFQFKIRWL